MVSDHIRLGVQDDSGKFFLRQAPPLLANRT